MRNPAETLLVTDAIRTREGLSYYAGSSFISFSTTGFQHARHNESGDKGTVNVLWCDGHVTGRSLVRGIFEPTSYVAEFGACDGAGGYGNWDR